MIPGTRLANIGNMPDVQQTPVPNGAPENAPETPPKSAPPKKTGWLVIAVAVVLGAAGMFVWWGSQPSTGATESAGESTLALETFVVNLSGSGQRAYLRVGITLGLARPLPTRRQADAAPIALVRDTILSVLATAQPEELLRIEGKRRLKEEVLKALRERVPEIAVQNVYFTEFLVQM